MSVIYLDRVCVCLRSIQILLQLTSSIQSILISGDEMYNDNRAGWDDNGNDKMYVECSDLIPKSVPCPNGG